MFIKDSLRRLFTFWIKNGIHEQHPFGSRRPRHGGPLATQRTLSAKAHGQPGSSRRPRRSYNQHGRRGAARAATKRWMEAVVVANGCLAEMRARRASGAAFGVKLELAVHGHCSHRSVRRRRPPHPAASMLPPPPPAQRKVSDGVAPARLSGGKALGGPPWHARRGRPHLFSGRGVCHCAPGASTKGRDQGTNLTVQNRTRIAIRACQHSS